MDRLPCIPEGVPICFQHFFPYFDAAGTDWPKQLSATLGAVATEGAAATLSLNLELMVAALKNDHGFARGYLDGILQEDWRRRTSPTSC